MEQQSNRKAQMTDREKTYVERQLTLLLNGIENRRKKGFEPTEFQAERLQIIQSGCINGNHDFETAIDAFSGREYLSCRGCQFETINQ